MRVVFGAAIIAAAAVAGASCGSVTDPSKNVTETVTGTITPVKLGGSGAGQLHMFNFGSGGEYTVKVTTMTPNFGGFLLVTLANGSGCGLLVNQQPALVGAQALTGPVFQTGQYCVSVQDYQNAMTTTESYTLTVNHP